MEEEYKLESSILSKEEFTLHLNKLIPYMDTYQFLDDQTDTLCMDDMYTEYSINPETYHNNLLGVFFPRYYIFNYLTIDMLPIEYFSNSVANVIFKYILSNIFNKKPKTILVKGFHVYNSNLENIDYHGNIDSVEEACEVFVSLGAILTNMIQKVHTGTRQFNLNYQDLESYYEETIYHNTLKNSLYFIRKSEAVLVKMNGYPLTPSLLSYKMEVLEFYKQLINTLKTKIMENKKSKSDYLEMYGMRVNGENTEGDTKGAKATKYCDDSDGDAGGVDVVSTDLPTIKFIDSMDKLNKSYLDRILACIEKIAEIQNDF